MGGIDCALFLDMGSSSPNRRYGSSSSAIGPGRVVEALLAHIWGIIDVIEVVVAVVSVSGLIVGAEGGEHSLR